MSGINIISQSFNCEKPQSKSGIIKDEKSTGATLHKTLQQCIACKKLQRYTLNKALDTRRLSDSSKCWNASVVICNLEKLFVKKLSARASPWIAKDFLRPALILQYKMRDRNTYATTADKVRML